MDVNIIRKGYLCLNDYHTKTIDKRKLHWKCLLHKSICFHLVFFIPRRSWRDIVLALSVRPSVCPSIQSVCPHLLSVRDHISVPIGQIYFNLGANDKYHELSISYNTASNLCLLLQKEQNVKGGEGPSGKQAVGINNGTGKLCWHIFNHK